MVGQAAEAGMEGRPGSAEPLMTVAGLRKVYGDRAILDLDRLEVRRGEILAVMGPSGSGKTTLLRLMTTLDEPTAGEVRFDGLAWAAHAGRANGRILSEAELVRWRRRISLVPHNPVLFTGTVRDNVALGLWLRSDDSKAATGRVERALDEVGLRSLAGAAVGSLSAGEVQRAALARALVTNPDLLLLDEPTANLDPANVATIERAIADAVRTRGLAAVIVTHNLFQARRLAARTALLVSGRLIEVGETGQVFERPSQPLTAAFLRGEMVC